MMRYETIMEHGTEEQKQEVRESVARVQAGWYTEMKCFDSILHPYQQRQWYKVYWKVKEQIKMYCRVAYRKVFKP